MSKKKNVLMSFDEKDLEKLDAIKEWLWLRFRHIAVSFLVNRYIKEIWIDKIKSKSEEK